MERGGLVVAIALLAGGFVACGGGAPTAPAVASATPPDPVDAVEDDFPADASGERYHPMHRAASYCQVLWIGHS